MADDLRDVMPAGIRLGGDLRIVKVKLEGYNAGFEDFVIHAELAASRSSLIRRFAEEQPGLDAVVVNMNMTEVGDGYEGRSRPGIAWMFDTWVNWLYKERLATKSSSPADSHDKEYERLVFLYELGLYLEDVKFQNAVLDAIISKDRDIATPFACDINARHMICYYYSSDRPEDNKAKSLLTTLFANKATSDALTGFYWPEEFLVEVSGRLVQATQPIDTVSKLLGLRKELEEEHGVLPGPVDKHLTVCDFHNHALGEKCKTHVHITTDKDRDCKTCYPPTPKWKRGSKRKINALS